MISHFLIYTIVNFLVANPVVEKAGGFVYQPHGISATEKFELGLYSLLPVYALGVEPRQELKDSALSNNAIPAEYQADVIKRLKRVLKTELLPPVLDDIQWSGYREFAWKTNSLITSYTCPKREMHVLLNCRSSDISVAITSNQLFNEGVADLTSGKIIESASRVLNIPSEMIPKIVEQKETIIEGIPICYGVMRCEFDDTAPSIEPKEWWRRIPFWMIKGKMYMDIWTEEYLRASVEDPWKF